MNVIILVGHTSTLCSVPDFTSGGPAAAGPARYKRILIKWDTHIRKKQRVGGGGVMRVLSFN